MKFYLSSFRIGNESEKLKSMAQNSNKKVAYISNAVDYLDDEEFRNMIETNDISDLQELGFEVTTIDLKVYFEKKEKLEERMNEFDIVWITGGNAFVLLQAMKLSGLDSILKKWNKKKIDKIYGGFSAATYVLAPELNGMHLVDDQDEKPYGEEHKAIWNGLGILDYVIVPHYKSEHFESEAVEKAIQYFIDHKIHFKALRDGEVIVVDS